MRSTSNARGLFFELSVDMLCIADSAGSFVDVNEAWTRTLGWTAEELCAVPFTDFVHPDDVAATINETMALNEGHITVNFENRYQCKDRSFVWLSWKATSVPSPEDPDGERLIFAVAHDISDRKQMEEALRHLADHDGLTGLWCRRRFEQEVAKQVARCRRYGEHAALFLLDVDHFKQVNDTHGHAVGDELLKHVATTLQERLRASDSPARLGGDEFAVLLPHMAPDQAAETAEAIAMHLRDNPLIVNGSPLPISASTGIAFLDKTVSTADEPMVRADRAMYDAKATGRDQISGLRQPSSTAPADHSRVYHCDDSESYRRLLAEMLEAHADLTVIGGANTHADALEGIAIDCPDVILLDALMGTDDAVSFIADLRASCPELGVLILSGLDRCPEPLAERTDGFIAKRNTFDEIAGAIRAVAARSAAIR